MTSNDKTIGLKELYMISDPPSWEEQIKTAKGYIIYRITNIIENKVYIGKAKHGFYDRYKGGKWWKLSHNEQLKLDYTRLGKQAFIVDIFEQGLSSESATELEIFLIYTHNSLFPNGYNMCYSSNNRTKESIEKIRQKLLVPIYQIDLKTNKIIKEFPGTIDAEGETGISNANISAVLNKRRISAGGFHWRRKDDKDTEIREKKTFGKKKVAQLDKDNLSIISVFPSGHAAAKHVNGSQTGVSWACRNNTIAFGYKWKYLT